MLDSEELAKRLVTAMDKADPPVSSASLAKRCGVTPQAVSGWRKDGRIAKRHLSDIAEITGRPLRYFLEDKPATQPEITMPLVEFKKMIQEGRELLREIVEERTKLEKARTPKHAENEGRRGAKKKGALQ